MGRTFQSAFCEKHTKPNRRRAKSISTVAGFYGACSRIRKRLEQILCSSHRREGRSGQPKWRRTATFFASCETVVCRTNGPPSRSPGAAFETLLVGVSLEGIRDAAAVAPMKTSAANRAMRHIYPISFTGKREC